MTPSLLEAIRAVPARVGVYYCDLASGHRWGWNADDDFPAASVIKVPILLAVYRQAQRSALDLSRRLPVLFQHHVGGAGILFELHDGIEVTVEDLCRLMIVISDNVASNLLLELVGMDEVRKLLQDLGMEKTLLGRRFMEAARPGADNRTTPADCGSCLEQFYSGGVLDRSHTSAALAILRRQQYREKIPLLLPPELPVAHKTGELEGVRHDMAVVEVPGRPYVLVLLTDKGAAPSEVDRALAQLSWQVYQWHLEVHP